jgi:integrase
MRGSVVKKGERYYVKIELDPDPLTGRRRQKWHSGFRTKREAEKARVDLLSKFDRGEYVEPTQQTLADYLTEWLAAIKHTVRPSTFDSYERNMRNHVIAHIGATRLAKVDAAVLNGLYVLLLTSGRRQPSRTGRGYSPEVVERALELRADGRSLAATAEQLQTEFDEASYITKDTLASLLRRQSQRRAVDDLPDGLDRRTVNYVHTILHRAFKDAVRWGRLARNPADAADPPRASQKSDGVQAWDAATLRTFLARSRESGDRLHALWVLLATTGMRRGEAIGLRWKDVDLDKGRLRIVQTITQTRSKVTIGEPKTSSGRRSIALDNATIDVLRDHRKAMLEERLLVGPDFSDEGLVFHHPDGACLRPDAVSAQFLRRVGRYGLPRLTLHGLRHTWATLALEQGIHPRVVQERLGHSTIAITLGIYSHVAPTLHDEAASRVSSLLLSPTARDGSTETAR